MDGACMCVCLYVCMYVCMYVCLCTKCVSKFFSAVYGQIFMKLGHKVRTYRESRMHKYDVISAKVKVTGRSFVENSKIKISQLFINRFL